MRVLLCDDHRMLSEALADVLSARGDEVVMTSDPQEAAAVVATWVPVVCLMDRTFPGGDLGVEGTRALLALAPDLRVLMLTGNPDAACARAAVAAGVRGFLRKDEPLDGVLTAIDQVAAGLLVVDASVLRPAAVRRSRGAPPGLTQREQDVLQRMVRGESGSHMAARMDITHSTVRTHVQSVLTKLGVHSQLEAAAHAVRHGLVQPEAG